MRVMLLLLPTTALLCTVATAPITFHVSYEDCVNTERYDQLREGPAFAKDGMTCQKWKLGTSIEEHCCRKDTDPIMAIIRGIAGNTRFGLPGSK